MFELMYYPLIHPPKPTLLEATLYWDSLTSLVPEPARRNFYILDDDLRLLEDEGLYRRTELEPMMFQQDDAIGRVMKTITRVIKRADPETLVIPDRLAADTRLWSGKLPWVVEERLRSRRLLVADDRQEGALRGNPQVLLATIACFAEEASMLLERQTGDRVVPSTDNRYAHACATIPLAKSNTQVSWMIDVGQLLPIPDPHTPLTEVVQFRRRYGDELRRCMQASRKLLAELRQEIDNPREVVMAFEGQLAEAITDVRSAGKSRFRWAARRTSWFAVATGATAIAGSATAEGFSSAMPLVLAASTVAGGVAVNLASASTRQRDERFSYLHQLSATFPSATPST
jgi:hypothetical protein